MKQTKENNDMYDILILILYSKKTCTFVGQMLIFTFVCCTILVVTV
ncbi:hypothetical protein HMPREF1551_02070 [Capnocytophaga sp. oral taxon 863 str. F0517]|nr:hypothetical protein HMPREF1551_02070 [Capnocytophaga sp. oral taxon 863 str. F0517]